VGKSFCRQCLRRSKRARDVDHSDTPLPRLKQSLLDSNGPLGQYTGSGRGTSLSRSTPQDKRPRCLALQILRHSSCPVQQSRTVAWEPRRPDKSARFCTVCRPDRSLAQGSNVLEQWLHHTVSCRNCCLRSGILLDIASLHRHDVRAHNEREFIRARAVLEADVFSVCYVCARARVWLCLCVCMRMVCAHACMLYKQKPRGSELSAPQ
jgi:hypothetical protein